MAGATGFGQTFFISLYAGAWREEFGLSHGDWGAIYMAATLTSAVVLTQAGRLADVWRARTLALLIVAAFSAICVGIANVSSWWMLGALVFGLRFCGQGMLSHVAFTAMGKWFRANRARAVAVASLGFSASEAVLPAAALTVIGLIGWRASWLVAAAALIFVVAPLLLWLLRKERSPKQVADLVVSPGMEERHWTRAEMRRHWVFWALLPGLLGPSWIGTVIFFQIIHLTEIKGWAAIDYAAIAYPAFSVLTIAASFAFGWAADRFGAIRLLPVYLLGWAAGAALMGVAGPLWAGAAALAVAGIGTGGVTVVHGALFAELYGTRWLGGIKAIAAAIMVLASALGPGVSGALLDAGVGFETQCYWMGAYLVAVSLWFALLAPKLIAATPRDVELERPISG
ncbi:MAG: MFS transporter [Pseudomonadota bacterium]